MVILVDESGVTVVGADDLKRFHVEAPAGLAVDGVLRASGFGSGGDDGDAMVVVAAVRAAVADAVDLATWTPQFDGMLGYARSKGWLSDDGTLIQAHVERH